MLSSNEEIFWGLSFGHHDAAIAVVKNGQLVHASHSERYSRIKNDPSLHPSQIEEAFGYGLPAKLFYYENSTLKKLRYLRSREWFRLSESPAKNFARIASQVDPRLAKVGFVQGNHHLSHAAAGFYCSNFSDALVIICDAIGESQTLTIREAQNGVLKSKEIFSLKYPHSVGLFYSAITKAVGLKSNEEEYILMGMAAYGNPSVHKNKLLQHIKTKNESWRTTHNFHRGFKIELHQDEMHWAAATQSITEDYLLGIFSSLRHRFPNNRQWVFGGGVALNCVLNSKIAASLGQDHKLFIFPNPGDAGSAVGSVSAESRRKIDFKNSFLGSEIRPQSSHEFIAQKIFDKKIIGLARGRAEFGPRALGNRSLLADPRGRQTKSLVNKIKNRQEFRPFAAAILEEYCDEYFVLPPGIRKSPFMQFTAKVKRPDLYPAICHVDNSSRIQTVSGEENPELHKLLSAWYRISGCPMLLNTSLNIRGEPLVNDLKHAKCFAEKYEVDVLS